MSTTFYIRYNDTQHDEQQPEGSKKQTKAAQRADLLHNNRSAANSLAQTIGVASSSTQEAQVESTVNPTPLRERQSRPESAAGEPTPLSAPQAGIFRSGPRATRFAAAALLSSLGSRSCCSQQRSSSTACRSRACDGERARKCTHSGRSASTERLNRLPAPCFFLSRHVGSPGRQPVPSAPRSDRFFPIC